MFVAQFTHGETISRQDDAQAATSYYELGLACFSTDGAVDWIEAHMWFNLAAMEGDVHAAAARADAADQMTAQQIVEAQRRARAYRLTLG